MGKAAIGIPVMTKPTQSMTDTKKALRKLRKLLRLCRVDYEIWSHLDAMNHWRETCLDRIARIDRALKPGKRK